MMEVLTVDDPNPTLPVWTPPSPDIFLIAQQFNTDDPGPYYFDGCARWRSSDLRTDPNLVDKVWFFPYFLQEWDSPPQGSMEVPFRLFWRISPAYDATLPGFDSTWGHDELSPYIWTDGSQYGPLANRQEVFDVHWGNNYYDFFDFDSSEMRLMSPSLLYNPCAPGDLVDENGNITIYAYSLDYYDVQSPVASVVIHVEAGPCCGGPIPLFRPRVFSVSTG